MKTSSLNRTESGAAAWWGSLRLPHRYMIITAIGMAVLSFARIATNAPGLTAAGQIERSMILMLPILMAGSGGLFAERVGIINIGLEGMMVLGTWFAGFGGYHFGPWGALIGGIVGGALGGGVHALLTVIFGVNHTISGFAINLLVGTTGSGLVRYLSNLYFKGRGSGSQTNSPGFTGTTGQIRIPFLTNSLHTTNWLAKIGKHQWFVISDFANVLNGFFGILRLEVVIGLLMIPLTWWVLWRTKFGLSLRSCGERPSAADSLGVNVYKIQILAVIISGAFAGLGGAILVLDNSGAYLEGQTANRGFIGLAALIFGNWRPVGIFIGAALFGYTDALQVRTTSGDKSVIALFLIGVVVTAFFAFRAWRKGDTKAMLRSLLVTAVVLALYLIKFEAPDDIVKALPYLATLVILTASSKRLRPPAASGIVWRKGMVG